LADFWYRCSLAWRPDGGRTVLRAWFATCRVRVRGRERREDPQRTIPALPLSGTIVLSLFYYFRDFRAAVMVSASKDGEYIARLAQLMGHVPVRGSSNRGGFGPCAR
jgi:lysophospholipid acyltransferase (LPLAT)-like uncharacterized protein